MFTTDYAILFGPHVEWFTTAAGVRLVICLTDGRSTPTLWSGYFRTTLRSRKSPRFGGGPGKPYSKLTVPHGAAKVQTSYKIPGGGEVTSIDKQSSDRCASMTARFRSRMPVITPVCPA